MCVRSLRGPGAFAGAIYALTDRPACAPATTTVVAVSAERDGLFGLECRRRAAKPSRPPAQVPGPRRLRTHMPNSASPANRPQATTATATLGSGVDAAAAPMMAAARRRIRQHTEAAP